MTKELEVIKLSFSNFSQQQCSVATNILQNSIHALRVLPNSVTISCAVLQLEKKKSINFIMTFAHFSLEEE